MKLVIEQLESRITPTVTLTLHGDTLVVRGDGWDDTVLIEPSETGVRVTAGDGGGFRTEEVPEPAYILAALRGGDDVLVQTVDIPTAAFMGCGNDVAITAEAADWIFGGPGNDVLQSGGGRDVVNGGAGDDWLESGLDATPDVVIGGGGYDLAVIPLIPPPGFWRTIDVESGIETRITEFLPGQFGPVEATDYLMEGVLDAA